MNSKEWDWKLGYSSKTCVLGISEKSSRFLFCIQQVHRFFSSCYFLTLPTLSLCVHLSGYLPLSLVLSPSFLFSLLLTTLPLSDHLHFPQPSFLLLALSSCHTLLLSSFFSSYSLGLVVLLDVLLPFVPCPLASCLRPLALSQGPLLFLPLFMAFHNHSPSIYCLCSFLLQLVFLCKAKKMAPYFWTHDPKARPL